ncbi:MAG: hypothetical protein IPK92_06520 [Nitrospira sp.]|jgi:hypothetical protein|nr:hypothetical protein [Nitrospira sp.]
MLSLTTPFVLRLSKDEQRAFQQTAKRLQSYHNIRKVLRWERHAGRSLSQNSRINGSRLQIEPGKFTNDSEYTNDQNRSKLLTLKDTSQEGMKLPAASCGVSQN